MFIVSAHLKSGGQPIVLTYDEEERAGKMYDSFLSKNLEGQSSDDYGTYVRIVVAEIAAVTFTNVDKENTKQIALQLKQARAQVRFQKAVQRDPAIKLMQGSGGLNA